MMYWVSCKNERVCFEKKYITGKAGFYTLTNDTLVDSTLPAVIIQTDTLATLYANAQGGRLHFSSVDSVIKTWVISDTSLTIKPDTLTFYYSKSLNYVSPNCGYNYFYTIDSLHYSRNAIDSVIINDNLINSDVNKVHIKIVF